MYCSVKVMYIFLKILLNLLIDPAFIYIIYLFKIHLKSQARSQNGKDIDLEAVSNNLPLFQFLVQA